MAAAVSASGCRGTAAGFFGLPGVHWVPAGCAGAHTAWRSAASCPCVGAAADCDSAAERWLLVAAVLAGFALLVATGTPGLATGAALLSGTTWPDLSTRPVCLSASWTAALVNTAASTAGLATGLSTSADRHWRVLHVSLCLWLPLASWDALAGLGAASCSLTAAVGAACMSASFAAVVAGTSSVLA